VCAIRQISVGRSVSHLVTCRVVYKISTCAVQAGVVQRVKVYTIVELLIVQVCSTLHTVGCIKSTTKYPPHMAYHRFWMAVIIIYIFLHGKTRSPVSLLQQSDSLNPAIIYCCHRLGCSCTCVGLNASHSIDHKHSLPKMVWNNYTHQQGSASLFCVTQYEMCYK